jgi:phosphomannomutase
MTEIRFGTDGWRGVIADDFTFANVRLVARAIGRRVRAEAGAGARVLVGHDTRFLAGEFARAAAESLAREDLAVGLTSRFAPTPAFSYAVVDRQAFGAVVVTASHNPPRYSGLKFKASFGGSAPVAFTRAVEEEIRTLQAEHPSPPPGCRPGGSRRGTPSAEPGAGGGADAGSPPPAIEAFDPVDPWLDRLEQFVDMARLGRSGIRVILDVMYGAGQGLLAERLRRAGCQVEELHAELNPAFGGLHPEPIPKYLGALQARLREAAAAPRRVGFAFDGDSDRIAPVDETGRVITPHETLALLLRHLVEHRTLRGPVVRSVNIGRMVDAEAERLGLPVVVTPIGFKFIAEAMQAHDALLGGEESGGFAVRGYIPERDAALIALLLLDCMAATGRSLGALVGELERAHGAYRYGRLDLTLPSLARRDRVVEALRTSPPPDLAGRRVAGVETLDGVRLDLADRAWLMLRASGTEPLLRIYAEAGSEADVAALLAWGRARALDEEDGDGRTPAQE